MLDADVCLSHTVTPMRRLSFFISDDLDAGIKALKAEHGTPEAETIRRALTMYLADKGLVKPAGAKAASARKRKGGMR